MLKVQKGMHFIFNGLLYMTVPDVGKAQQHKSYKDYKDIAQLFPAPWGLWTITIWCLSGLLHLFL